MTMASLARGGAEAAILGRCPNCDADIPAAGLLIEYETDGGWPQMFAECPACADVVHPR